MNSNIKLENSWKELLESEFYKDYMKNLKNFLLEQYNQKKQIFPSTSEYFSALNNTPFQEVKVVIIGQDPYHGLNQAHGLCFSVKKGVEPPPSLKNIFKELKNDLNVDPPDHGNLISWAKQGVLLLNSVLTVIKGNPGAHQGKGWEIFTDKVVEILNKNKKNLVFLLWGAYAQKKGEKINHQKHLILTAPHPSPLSANKGFFGCKHFSKTNNYLKQNNKKEINWHLN